MKKIGMLTIGQSPRSDILPGLIEILGEAYEVFEAGALDGLTIEDIRSLDIGADDYVLVSRMRDGTEIKITKAFILPLMQRRLEELESKGVRLTVIMCTGKFPPLESKGLVVTPSEILKGAIEGAIKKGRLGVVYPAEEQVKGALASFGKEGVEVYADFLSPYDVENGLNGLANRLAYQNLDLILLNYFGFGGDVKRAIAERTGKPVIQPNTLVARVLKEFS